MTLSPASSAVLRLRPATAADAPVLAAWDGQPHVIVSVTDDPDAETDALGLGHGTRMMTMALDACFARPEVEAVLIDPLNSNTDAHRFYRRLGFRPEGRRLFNDEDDCLVHRLTRAGWAERTAA